MSLHSIAAFVLVASLIACGPDEPGALSVDLTTDLVPGYELGEAQVEIRSLGRFVREQISVESSRPMLRIARMDDIEQGSYSVDVRLYDVEGGLIFAQTYNPIPVRVESVLPVVYTRGCREVDCPPIDDPEATACINRECVDPQCRPETPLFCESALCEAVDDCAPPAADCARVECLDGACLDVPIERACPPEFVCTAEGCVPGLGVELDAGPSCVPGGSCDTGNACEVGEIACVDDEPVCMGTPAPATVVCRESAGPCDALETCDGVSPGCPADGVADATVVCRPATGSCDLPESCDGVSTACPADLVSPEGTMCAPDRNTPNECICRDDGMVVTRSNTFVSACDAAGACVETLDRWVDILVCFEDPPPPC